MRNPIIIFFEVSEFFFICQIQDGEFNTIAAKLNGLPFQIFENGKSLQI